MAVDPAADASTLQKATDWYEAPQAGKRFQYFDLVDAILDFGTPQILPNLRARTRLQSGTFRTAVQNA